jgi:GT2 family glycosyltransferase/glycosyltransferase involved in cell wall biosynthesis
VTARRITTLAQGIDVSGILARLDGASPVAVLIPVFNGGTVVERCVESVLRHTPRDVAVHLLDDASTDPATVAFLARVGDSPRVTVTRNAVNLGYTRNVNRGLAEAAGSDVVLLNSDTTVGPFWLQRLRWVAYGAGNRAAVSAASDNAGAMALPEPGRSNDWRHPAGWTAAARLVAQSCETFEVDAVTIHGFCVYLRRDALGDIGGFDAESFPRGYGEENDWSMRARRRGWSLAWAPHTFVRHVGGATFGAARDELMASAAVAVDRLHPSYQDEVREWMGGPTMRRLRENSATWQHALETTDPRPRRMYVIHMSGGGAPATNLDLLGELDAEQDSLLVAVSPDRVTIRVRTAGEWADVDDWSPDPAFKLGEDWRVDLAARLAAVMIRFAVELVHIRHLINQPLTTVSRVAELLGIPVILSTHDFYYVCPTVNLIDGEDRFCGGHCTPSTTRCRLPSTFVADAVNLKHDRVFEWRDRARPVLTGADAVIATSEFAKGVYLDHFPEIASTIHVIEHGRAEPGRPLPLARSVRDRRAGPLRVFCPANWGLQKGSELVAELIELTAPVIEWHLAGKFSERVHATAIAYGTYERSDLARLVDQVDPDVVGLFSITPETYSHTLSEAWGLGLPVIAGDFGAIAERVRAHGGGILVDLADRTAVAERLIDLGRRLLRAEPLGLPLPSESGVRPVEAMAQDYSDLYRTAAHRAPSPVRIGVVSSRGRGTSYVRVMSRVSRFDDDLRVSFARVDASEFATGSDRRRFDALLIQRDALAGVDAPLFWEHVRRHDTRVVFDLDDDLVSDASVPRVSAERRAAAITALRGADSVMVSSPVLADLVRGWSSAQVEVFPNLLDPAVWSDRGRPPTDHLRGRRGGYRWVYIGTATHQNDLEMLRDVFAPRRGQPRFELDVIGVTERRGRWYSRIQVPPGTSEYRRFARWLSGLARDRGWVGGLAPLIDDDFNRGKSDLKPLEYAMLGLPSIASRVGPYIELGGRGVKLCDDNPQSWRDAMEQAVADSAFTRRVPTADYVRQERTLDDRAELERWLSFLVGGGRRGAEVEVE